MILYEGPSELTGDPIVVIATSTSKNTKTGAMVQTWIIRADVEPHTAVKEHADTAICGDCPLSAGRGCYVKTFQAPLAVYRAYKRGNYQHVAAESLAHMDVRIGAYGDPAAAPLSLWTAIKAVAHSTTGYTHQWHTCDRGYRAVAMASVETIAEAKQAQALGYRTFRTTLATDDKQSNEFRCPASSEMGRNKLTCQQCRRCGGADGTKSSAVIQAHGSGRKHFVRFQ